MPETPNNVPGDLQMTDEMLALENARSRTVGLVSVMTVALFSCFILCSYFALKGATTSDAVKYLTAISEHKLLFILAGLFFSMATLFVAVLLTHVLFAVRQRTSRMAKFPLYVAIAGPILVALIYPVYTLFNVAAANDLVSAAHPTAEMAKDLASSSAIQVTRSVWVVGQILLTAAWVMTGIYGMRVGLLTRMMGFFAIAIGAANFIAPPFAALLQIFWIGAVAILLIGESAQTPPAWKLGRPVPWSEVDAMRREVGTDEDPSDFNKSEQ